MLSKIIDGSLVLTDTRTGEVRELKLATEKQMYLIRQLEKDLKLKPKAYRNLTIWQAKKLIGRLVKRPRPML